MQRCHVLIERRTEANQLALSFSNSAIAPSLAGAAFRLAMVSSSRSSVIRLLQAAARRSLTKGPYRSRRALAPDPAKASSPIAAASAFGGFPRGVPFKSRDKAVNLAGMQIEGGDSVSGCGSSHWHDIAQKSLAAAGRRFLTLCRPTPLASGCSRDNSVLLALAKDRGGCAKAAGLLKVDEPAAPT